LFVLDVLTITGQDRQKKQAAGFPGRGAASTSEAASSTRGIVSGPWPEVMREPRSRAFKKTKRTKIEFDI
jgi:hypothetical protein